MKKTKKIKSFTVNEDTYNRLVKVFKDSYCSYSLSSLVNDFLEALDYNLTRILDVCEKENIDIDLHWIVERIVEDARLCPPSWDIEDDEFFEKMDQQARESTESYLYWYKDEQERRKNMMKKVGKLKKKLDKEMGGGK